MDGCGMKFVLCLCWLANPYKEALWLSRLEYLQNYFRFKDAVECAMEVLDSFETCRPTTKKHFFLEDKMKTFCFSPAIILQTVFFRIHFGCVREWKPDLAAVFVLLVQLWLQQPRVLCHVHPQRVGGCILPEHCVLGRSIFGNFCRCVSGCYCWLLSVRV